MDRPKPRKMVRIIYIRKLKDSLSIM